MITKTNRSLPVLSENKYWRYFNFIALYIAQGIPEGITYFAIPAWLAMNGKTPGEIGTFVAVLGIPWSFKIIVAPLMDRFSFLPMGRRRPWVIFGQLGLIASFIALAFVPDPLNNLSLLMMAGFAVSFFGAFQDVATDGMAIDIVPVSQQARANGFMWGSKIMGTAASLATGSWLINAYGFSTAILILSILVGLIMIVPICLRERVGEKLLPWSEGTSSPDTLKMKINTWKDIFSSLYKVFSLRNSLLFALFAFLGSAAWNYLDTLIPIFAVQGLGWTDQEYSRFYATATLIGGISGILIGGIMIDKFGKMRMLNCYIFLLILLVSALAFLKSFWINTWFISAFMILFQILYVFTLIGLFAIAMQCCWKKVSASQFTLYMTICNMGRIVGAKAIGPIKEQFSWEYTIFACVLIMIAAWLVLQLFYLSHQEKRVNEIDAIETKTHMPAMA